MDENNQIRQIPRQHALLNADLEFPDVFSVIGGAVAAYSHRSPIKETSNEDCAAFIQCGEHCAVFMVADGLGGLPAGAAASRRTIEVVLEQIARRHENELSVRDAILNGVERANRELLEGGVGNATTIVIAEIADGLVRSYHVGDAMMLVTGQRGKLKLQTISHSPIGYALESGLIDEKQAMSHTERHVVSNVIGSDNMRIEVGTEVKLAKRDSVLVASDGVFDNLYVEEIKDIIRTGALPDSARELHTRVRERMDGPTENLPRHPDDCTFLLFRPAM